MEKKRSKTGKEKKSFIQLIKFAIVGASNTVIDFVVSMVLNALLHWYYPAKVVGYCLGVANSYLLNSRWTFKEERRKDAREIISFIAVNLAVLLISLGLMSLFKDVVRLGDRWMSTGLPEWLKKLLDGERVCMLLSTCISLIINFIGNKLFVFKANASDESKAE